MRSDGVVMDLSLSENSGSTEKSSDLSCPAVVSRACSHSARCFFHGSLVGFAVAGNWSSRSGRPSVDGETRDLIRQMNAANPLWGAPRIHGELLKLGIEISQATVAKYMVRRPGTPSPTWRSFLRNQVAGIAAIDMFVVASASFRLLYVMIILAHDRRRIIHAAVTEHPTAAWLSRQVTEAFPWDTAPRYLLARSRCLVWPALYERGLWRLRLQSVRSFSLREFLAPRE
jgi:hypothetical protein